MLMGCYPPDLGSEPPSRRNNRHGNVDYGGQHHATQSRPGRQWIYRVRARRLASLKAISKTSRAAVSRVRVRQRFCSPRPWGSPLRALRSGAGVASLRRPILLPAELSRTSGGRAAGLGAASDKPWMAWLAFCASRDAERRNSCRRTGRQGWRPWTFPRSRMAQRERSAARSSF